MLWGFSQHDLIFRLVVWPALAKTMQPCSGSHGTGHGQDNAAMQWLAWDRPWPALGRVCLRPMLYTHCQISIQQRMVQTAQTLQKIQQKIGSGRHVRIEATGWTLELLCRSASHAPYFRSGEGRLEGIGVVASSTLTVQAAGKLVGSCPAPSPRPGEWSLEGSGSVASGTLPVHEARELVRSCPQEGLCRGCSHNAWTDITAGCMRQVPGGDAGKITQKAFLRSLGRVRQLTLHAQDQVVRSMLHEQNVLLALDSMHATSGDQRRADVK